MRSLLSRHSVPPTSEYPFLLGFLLLVLIIREGKAMIHEPNACGKTNATTATDEPICADTHSQCEMWAEEGECADNEVYMLVACPCSCNSCPTYTKNEWDDEAQYAMGPLKEEIEYIIQTTEEYMRNYKKYFSSKIQWNCRNKHGGCSHWALLGECHFNPSFMLADCTAACRSCHSVKIKRL